MKAGNWTAPRVCGIYKILNTVNGKFYIGSSVNVRDRLSKHLSPLRQRTHRNAHLQAAFSAYGEGAFEVYLLEECEPSALLVREQAHIDALSPNYNICPGHELTDEHKAKVSAGLRQAWARDGNRSREQAAERARARWADPEWKAAQAAKIKEGKAAKRLLEKARGHAA